MGLQDDVEGGGLEYGQIAWEERDNTDESCEKKRGQPNNELVKYMHPHPLQIKYHNKAAVIVHVIIKWLLTKYEHFNQYILLTS